MTEPISDEKLADLRFWAEPIPGRSPDRDSKALTRKTMRSLLARLDAAEARAERAEDALQALLAEQYRKDMTQAVPEESS